MRVVQSWEDVWTELNEAFVRIAAIAHSTNSEIAWTINHWESEIFPFNGYIAFFPSNRRGEEELVVFVGAQRTGDSLTWTNEISTGDGVVIVDGPSFAVDASTPFESWAGDALDATIDFLHDAEAVIVRQLR